MSRTVLQAIAGIVLGAAIVGCARLSSAGGDIGLQTQPSPSPGALCPMARLGGWLVPDEQYGLGLRDGKDGGTVRGVVWPFGYTARQATGGIELLDQTGHVVAREGDRIVMAGAADDNAVSWPCNPPELEVVAS